jgi:hypothetical protein
MSIALILTISAGCTGTPLRLLVDENLFNFLKFQLEVVLRVEVDTTYVHTGPAENLLSKEIYHFPWDYGGHFLT